MALTLPYPSMNFVPLDVLTAAEQNQLVANIEYIANQFPITNANIGSAAVKSQNIDWTTIGLIASKTGTGASTETITQTANYTFNTIEGLKMTNVAVESGAKYLLTAVVCLASTYINGSVDFSVGIAVDGVSIGSIMTGGTAYQSIVVETEFTATSNNLTSVEVRIGGRVPGTYTVYLSTSSLRIIRVK